MIIKTVTTKTELHQALRLLKNSLIKGYSLEDTKAWYNELKAKIIVLKIDNEVVGALSFKYQNSYTVYILRIVSSVTRNNIAKLMLTYLETYIKMQTKPSERRYITIYAHIRLSNIASIITFKSIYYKLNKCDDYTYGNGEKSLKALKMI